MDPVKNYEQRLHRREIRRLLRTGIAVAGLGTLGFRLIENWSWADSFYMTIISVSTVGFGEVHPLSPAGQGFAVAVIIGGLLTTFKAASLLGITMLAMFSSLFLQGSLIPNARLWRERKIPIPKRNCSLLGPPAWSRPTS